MAIDFYKVKFYLLASMFCACGDLVFKWSSCVLGCYNRSVGLLVFNMRALGWNCRGLPRSVNALCEIVWRWDPNFVFLSETKLKKKAMDRAKRKMGFVYGLVVPKSDKSGGLAMLWKENINLEIMGYAVNFIDAIVTEADLGLKWRITGFYGHPKAHKRKESWDQLKALNLKFQLPWIYFGDFNEILSMNKKMGGVQRSQRQMDEFRDAVNSYGFKDLGYNGLDYTWCNMQEGENRMYIRLDRALATSKWMEQFKEARVYHIVDSTLDHCALLVSDSYHPQPPRKHCFHFEAM